MLKDFILKGLHLVINLRLALYSQLGYYQMSVVTGGSEAGICELGMGGFSTMHALTKWQGHPAEASRPFDAGRDGFAPAK